MLPDARTLTAAPHERRSADADAPVSRSEISLHAPRDKIVGFESDLFLRKSEPVISKKSNCGRLAT
jgi:hypothetical protein